MTGPATRPDRTAVSEAKPSERASQVRGRCRGFTALSTRDRPSVRTTKRLFALRALYTVITPELGQL